MLCMGERRKTLASSILYVCIYRHDAHPPRDARTLSSSLSGSFTGSVTDLWLPTCFWCWCRGWLVGWLVD